MSMGYGISRGDAQILPARLGASLAAALSEQAEQLPHEIGERLRFGRDKALGRARELRVVQPALASAVFGAPGGTAALGSPPPWWLRWANVLPVAMLVGGLLLIQHWQLYESTLAAAEIDAALLSDQVPPMAYADPGFVEFLRQPEP